MDKYRTENLGIWDAYPTPNRRNTGINVVGTR